jgi:hypothetical protein
LTDKWETCTIVRSVFRTDVDGNKRVEEGYFYADAVGVKGVFAAGDSPIFGNRWYWQDSQWHWASSGERSALGFLVNQLVKDGWEPTGAGSEWWEKHFRRRVGQVYPNPWDTWEVVVWGHSLVKSRFAVRRCPQGNEHRPSRGPLCSREFGALRSPRPHENQENTQILEEFLVQLESEGFELVPPSENERLRQCSSTEDLKSRDLWYVRFLIKRV